MFDNIICKLFVPKSAISKMVFQENFIFVIGISRVIFTFFSDSTYEVEFQYFLRGQEGLPLENIAPKVEGLSQAQASAMLQLSKLSPFRKLNQKVSGNAEFMSWLQSVAAEQDVPELWDTDKPLSKL